MLETLQSFCFVCFFNVLSSTFGLSFPTAFNVLQTSPCYSDKFTTSWKSYIHGISLIYNNVTSTYYLLTFLGTIYIYFLIVSHDINLRLGFEFMTILGQWSDILEDRHTNITKKSTTHLSLRTTPSIQAPKRTTLLKSTILRVKETDR